VELYHTLYNVAPSVVIPRALAFINATMLVVATVVTLLEFLYYPNPPAQDASVSNAADWATESARRCREGVGAWAHGGA
jgi:hypothetical protein